jgi:hypothetical protein
MTNRLNRQRVVWLDAGFAGPVAPRKSAMRLFLEGHFAHFLCAAQEMSKGSGD